ncbi:hypothetical protein JCM19235_1031 [Vibrio maritimus]|uniref:Uncharacterized protein n=1 Tax=Vibrio maritimus TaxID=990268 RepID=A0A090RW46_9VIBR|nr:hypothetical protein JCM19235_1031 [Vibrio maritimus]
MPIDAQLKYFLLIIAIKKPKALLSVPSMVRLPVRLLEVLLMAVMVRKLAL